MIYNMIYKIWFMVHEIIFINFPVRALKFEERHTII